MSNWGARLFRHLMALPIAYFEARQVGHSVARVRELDSIREFITGSSLVLLVDLFFTFVFFAVMWVFSPFLTIVVLCSLPFYILLAVFVTPVLRKRTEEKFQRGAENQAFLVESITGVETVRSLAVEPQAQRKWEDQLAGYVHSSFKLLNLGNIAGQSSQLINKVTTVLVLYFGALAVMQGELSVGQLCGVQHAGRARLRPDPAVGQLVERVPAGARVRVSAWVTSSTRRRSRASTPAGRCPRWSAGVSPSIM